MIQDNSTQNPGLNVANLGMMSAEDIVITPMGQDDLSTVSNMIRQGIGAYDEAGTVLVSTFRRLDNLKTFYHAPSSIYLVARDANHNGTIVGGAGVGPLHGLPPSEGLGEIRDLVVAPNYRGQGIGARLIKRSLDEAKRMGYKRLYLETTPQMEQARKLFIRYGFRPVTTGSPKVGQADDSMPCYYILESLS